MTQIMRPLAVDPDPAADTEILIDKEARRATRCHGQ